jgi:hypothetical protein
MASVKFMTKKVGETAIRDEDEIRDYFRGNGWRVLKTDKRKDIKRPDFLISDRARGLKFDLEIKSIYNQDEFTLQRKLESVALRQFKPKTTAAWNLLIDDPQINLAILKRDKQRRLEYEEMLFKKLRRFEMLVNRKLPGSPILPTEVQDDIFQLFLSPNSQDNNNNVSIITPCVLITNTYRIRQRIHDTAGKAKSVADFNRPFVLIFYNHAFFLKPENIEEALFGDITITWTLKSGGNSDSKFYHGKNASIQKNKNTWLSAIALYSTFPEKNFVIFHNPYAKLPLPKTIFEIPGNRQQLIIDRKKIWLPD